MKRPAVSTPHPRPDGAVAGDPAVPPLPLLTDPAGLLARQSTMREFAAAMASDNVVVVNASDGQPAGDPRGWEVWQMKAHEQAEATRPPYILRPINQGREFRLAKPARGPHSLDTQFDAFYEHRKGAFAKLVRNKIGGRKKLVAAQSLQAAIEAHVSALPRTVGKRGRVAAILLRCEKDRGMLKKPSRSTIQRALQKIDARESEETSQVV